MQARRRHADVGHIPAHSTWEPLADSAFFQPPQRIRCGADREITHELVADAIREWRRKGKRIRRIRMEMRDAVRGVTVKGHSKIVTPAGFQEVDVEMEGDK